MSRSRILVVFVAVSALIFAPSVASASTLDHLAVPSRRLIVQGIVKGPDGAMWVTLNSRSDPQAPGSRSAIMRITPSGARTEFRLPGGSQPTAITVGSDGALWFIEEGTYSIGRLTTTGNLSSFPMPNTPAIPWDITTGPDGNVWFTDWYNDELVKVTTTGTMTEYPVPRGINPYAIVSGSGGALWFAANGNDSIDRVTTSGKITQYPVKTMKPCGVGGSQPYDLTVGPDGNLWFTMDHPCIGKITPSGTVTEYPLPDRGVGRSITSGTDGNLWVTTVYSRQRDSITRVTTRGQATRFRVADQGRFTDITPGAGGDVWATFTRGSGCQEDAVLRIAHDGTTSPFRMPTDFGWPDQIAPGRDGMWFTQVLGDRVGLVTTTGSMRTFKLPGPCGRAQSITPGPGGDEWFSMWPDGDPGQGGIGRISSTGDIQLFPLAAGIHPRGIVEGSDGNLWFADPGLDGMGMMTPEGVVEEFPISVDTLYYPYAVALGPDGNVWFTGLQDNVIAKITPAGKVTAYPLSTGINQGHVGLAAGPDGRLWVTGYDEISRVSTTGHETVFPVSEFPDATCHPGAITPGPDGALWFSAACASGSKLGRITRIGSVQLFAVGRADLSGIAAGPDGALWFAEPYKQKIGRFVP